MEDNKNEQEESEKLRKENELRKLKLTAEKGAIFSDNSESDLSPEMENEFLNNMELFEKAHENARMVPIFEYAGKPDFRRESEIPDAEIEFELKEIRRKMLLKGMVMDTCCDVDPRILYRFITEEFLPGKTEVEDMEIPGWTRHFIYEEYHPNHEHDIRNHSKDFISSLLNKENDFYTTWIAGKADSERLSPTITIETFEKNILLFRSSFDSFSLNHFEIKSLDFGLENATLNFVINYSGKLEGSSETNLFDGVGKFDLIFSYDYWCISNIDMPGFSNE